ncbi:hypothetical protein AAY473_014164 [Plecturocebus cupreus]
MEALVCAFSELRMREDAVSQAQGRPGHPDAPPSIYEGGLGSQQPQCPSAQGSKPKNFRLRHLRGLALYLQGHPPPAGQCESHWLGRLMAWDCLPQPEGTAWPLDLPQGTLGPGNSHCSALLEAQLPRDSLGNTGELCQASSSSVDPAKGALPQPGPSEGLGLRPKRSWGASEEAMCPLYKRIRSGALERP